LGQPNSYWGKGGVLGSCWSIFSFQYCQFIGEKEIAGDAVLLPLHWQALTLEDITTVLLIGGHQFGKS